LSLAAAKLNEEHLYPDYAPRREISSPPKPQVGKKAAVMPQMVVITAVSLVFLTGLLLIMTQAMITSRSDSIIQTRAEITDLKNSNERLKLKIAELKSLERIDSIARTQLGMVSPQETSIEYIAFLEGAAAAETASSETALESSSAPEVEQVSVLQFLRRLVSGCLPVVLPAD